jgi:hypothetical protein
MPLRQFRASFGYVEQQRHLPLLRHWSQGAKSVVTLVSESQPLGQICSIEIIP